MSPGALNTIFDDWPGPFDRFDKATNELVDVALPLALCYFDGAGLGDMNEFGTEEEIFAKIRARASRHAANNPLALFRKVVTEEDVMASPLLRRINALKARRPMPGKKGRVPGALLPGPRNPPSHKTN